jgi:hypothetical protein
MDTSMSKKEQVEKRAYEIYQTQGSGHGRDLDHWLQAEKELSGEKKQQKKGNNFFKAQQSRNAI